MLMSPKTVLAIANGVLVVTTLQYAFLSAAFWYSGNKGLSMMYAGYAFANIGAILVSMNV